MKKQVIKAKRGQTIDVDVFYNNGDDVETAHYTDIWEVESHWGDIMLVNKAGDRRSYYNSILGYDLKGAHSVKVVATKPEFELPEDITD